MAKKLVNINHEILKNMEKTIEGKIKINAKQNNYVYIDLEDKAFKASMMKALDDLNKNVSTEMKFKWAPDGNINGLRMR